MVAPWKNGNAAIAAAAPFLLIVALFVGGALSQTTFSRKNFPEDFIFGTGSAAYQYEGAWNLDGKGLSIWDTFVHNTPDKIKDHTNGDVANDLYHRYKDDIKLLKDMNVDSFRFSISWPRILPKGNIAGGVNQKGIQFYKDFIDELVSNGITPFVTLFHWDLPQELETKYLGFLNADSFVKDYLDFAETCFSSFGDKVKHWNTFNEPHIFSTYAYGYGSFAPSRCSSGCSAGDSAREPYIVGHTILLAHSQAVRLYKQKYQAKQKGEIGITLNVAWFVPGEDTVADQAAANRSVEYMSDWFMHPIVYGDYPADMKAWLGNRLPSFKPDQSALLKGSYDFFGINYYTGYYAMSLPPPNNPSFDTDARANQSGYNTKNVAIGPVDASGAFFAYPKGLRKFLHYMKDRYNSPKVFVTENGRAQANDKSIPLEKALNDPERITYMREHIASIHLAIQQGVNVKGYFPWTFMDCFEWTGGYTTGFGLYYVDRATLKRHPKRSALFYSRFLGK